MQHESFMLHDMKLFWHPSVLESFLLLNTQFFTVYIVKKAYNCLVRKNLSKSFMFFSYDAMVHLSQITDFAIFLRAKTNEFFRL
jgi:hypothetical protein